MRTQPLWRAVRDAATVRRLYEALADLDGEAMAACYTADARLEDPAFGILEGPEVGAMWRMLCKGARDLVVEVDGVRASGGRGEAHWTCRYTFAPTGRPVRNEGHATFVFRDGRIASHTDAWDFHSWAGQALGPQGKMLGWSKAFHAQVTKRARAELRRFMAKEAARTPG